MPRRRKKTKTTTTTENLKAARFLLARPPGKPAFGYEPKQVARVPVSDSRCKALVNLISPDPLPPLIA